MVRIVVVGALCLLIGVAARQLFDAYGPDMMRFLKKKPAEAEVHLIPTPPLDIHPSGESVETF